MRRKSSYRARSTPFVVESNTWADWAEEQQFNTYKEAIEWGRENLPQNDWRIKNTISGRVVYKYDYATVLTDLARTDVTRINEHRINMTEFFSGQEERARWRQQQRDRERNRPIPIGEVLWDELFVTSKRQDKVDWKHEGF